MLSQYAGISHNQMIPDDDRQLYSLCNWSGIAFAVISLFGMAVCAGFIPPPSPAMSAGEVSGLYNEKPNAIRLGAILMMLGSAFFIPFTALITHYIMRIEGRLGVLSIMQIMAGMFNMLLFFFPCMWILAASFRLERSPELIQVLNDAAWIQYVGALFPFLFQLISVGIASFKDKSAKAIFPRWFGFLNLWTVLLYLPGQMIYFFKTGPFAWDGLLAFWLPGSTFFTWVLVTFFVMRQALKEEGCADLDNSMAVSPR